MIRLAVQYADRDGIGTLLSPDVAVFRPSVREGDVVHGGAVLGHAVCVGRTEIWVAPASLVPSRITDIPKERSVALAYGKPFARVEPLGFEVPLAKEEEQIRETHSVFCAPTDGVFYRSLSPGVPALAEVGDIVRDGDGIGLVEVMKTFNRVEYGGEELPLASRILEFLVEDGVEIHSGQPLLRVAGLTDES